jgi:hypothetical protein
VTLRDCRLVEQVRIRRTGRREMLKLHQRSRAYR